MIESIKNSNNNIILLILFIVYSIIMYFLFPIKTLGFLLSYTFSIIFFILSFIVLKYIRESYTSNNASLFTFAYLMLSLQLILSIFLSVFNIFFNITIIINVILLAIYLIVIILLFKSIDYIEEVQEDTKDKTFFLNNIQEELEIIKTYNINENISFEKLEETIRFSNPVSNEKTQSIESEITSYISELKVLLTDNTDANEIKKLIKLIQNKFEEREILLKHKY